MISGDIVKSTHLTPQEHKRATKCIEEVQAWMTERCSLNTHVVFRGDEFQSVVHDFESALIYAIALRVALKAHGKRFDARISLAIAANNTLDESVQKSFGNAFTLAGRGLKGMKKERLLFNTHNATLTESYRLLFLYLDRQLTMLTTRQCELMAPMLLSNMSLSVSELAETKNIAIATASISLNTAGWLLIQELNSQFRRDFTPLRLKGNNGETVK